MDHSMLTSFETVRNILSGSTEKSNIWNVNTEQVYHETDVQETEEDTAQRYRKNNKLCFPTENSARNFSEARLQLAVRSSFVLLA